MTAPPESGGLRHFGAVQEQIYHGKKFDAIDELKQAIVLEWRPLQQGLITASVNGDVVCSVRAED